MRIIKLDAIDSTNSYLRKMSVEEALDDYTIVLASEQTNGRGQMGTVWFSEKGKNLITSVYKRFEDVEAEENFSISMVVSISIVNALKSFQIKNLNVKWPNDIMADSLKIGGVLIENIIKNRRLEASIIGIGLNINQTYFNGLPKASSLRCVSGNHFSLDEIFYKIIVNLETSFKEWETNGIYQIKKEYHKYLFRRNKPSTFRNNDGHMFTGYIKGVTKNGSLEIIIEDGLIKEFELKEVELLY